MNRSTPKQVVANEETPLLLISPASLEQQPAEIRRVAKTAGFDARPGSLLPVSDIDGETGFLVGAPAADDRWGWAGIAEKLPKARYRLVDTLDPYAATEAVIGWELGGYRFSRRREAAETGSTLRMPENADAERANYTLDAMRLGRDLVNTPANLLGPSELAQAVIALVEKHGAKTNIVLGDDLLTQNYPAIHAVGASSERAPRLIEMRWGERANPKVTLVGKGVCFDTGGLNVKSMADMRHMKRDMGGAAIMIALAAMIMAAKLPVCLRLLVPAVDNVISHNAFRPGDVLTTRNGLTAEIANTDCEGRLVLADALAAASEEKPDIVIDAATLTGSARTAFGAEIGAMFTSDEAEGLALQKLSRQVEDPLWMMPLWAPYRSRIAAPVGNLLNMADGAYAGAITAALFLQEFVSPETLWVHLDVSAWNDRARPGRPVGGEVTGMQALFAFLSSKYPRPN